MNYKVNIVISTFNRLELTQKSLPSIIDLASDSVPHMISVIDNGSKDETPKYLQELFHEKKIHNLILLENNIGVAKAHNLLWKLFEDKVDIYGKVDNDILFSKNNWLDSIVKVLDTCPSVGMAGHSVEWYMNGANLRVPKEYPLMVENNIEYRFKNDNLGGACVFIPKRVREIFGYWQEGYALYGEEDTDYGYRLRISGLKNVYMKDLYTAYHLDESDTNYIEFKNNQRSKNTSGIFWQTLSMYRDKPETRKVNTNILNEIKFNLQSHIEV